MITILVMSSVKSSHLLPGFFHQWAKHWQRLGWDERFMVVTQSAVDTPAGWLQYRSEQDSPEKNWSGHLYDALRVVDTPVLLMMDDYWLCEPTKQQYIRAAYDEIGMSDKVDLSGDRFGFAHTDYNWEYIKSEPHAKYLSSTQAALWSLPFLTSLAYRNAAWNPWQFELEGDEYLHQFKIVNVLGAKSRPVQYANVSLRGQKRLRLDRLTPEDKRELLMVGAISKEDFFDE